MAPSTVVAIVPEEVRVVVAVLAAAAVIETATAAAPVVHARHWRGNSTLPQQTSRTLLSADARRKQDPRWRRRHDQNHGQP